MRARRSRMVTPALPYRVEGHYFVAETSTPKFTNEPCSKCGSPRSVVNGAWLRERRMAAGLSLREMARRLGFSAPYVSDVEKNKRNCLPKFRKAYESL